MIRRRYAKLCRQINAAGDANTREGFAGFILRRSVDLRMELGYSRFTFTVRLRTAGGIMTWTAPAFQEVCLNCEINSYASAKL
jgi:coenzyme PQQ precursor peptide PqqA